MKVDLPQPEGPIRAVTTFGCMCSVSPLQHLVVAEPGADVAGAQVTDPGGAGGARPSRS